jgi:predicted TIM-barrel fold metal-dependent hydrolase
VRDASKEAAMKPTGRATSTPGTFACSADHLHAAGCCDRRHILMGLAGLAAGTLLGPRSSAAQGAAQGAAQTTAPAKPARIDVHHHFSSPGFIGEIAGRRTGQVPLMRWTVEKSLADMDAGGVATAIVSISEPSVFFGNYDAARKLARETNDFAARMIAEHPGRFGLFATVPLPDVGGALLEIAYALDTLKADGICMMTDYDGKFLGDPAFTPVMEELNRRKAVVYTHPFRNACCRNLVPDVFEPTIELGTDTTRTIASLMFGTGGTAFRCPDIRFIWSHSGGTLPFLIGRLIREQVVKKNPNMPDGPMPIVQKYFYEIAQGNLPGQFAALLDLVPVSQLMFGSDFPFRDGAEASEGLAAYRGFSDADRASINFGTALKLMPGLAAT